MPPLPYALRRVFVTLPRPYKQGLAIAFDAFILLLSFQLALWFRFELFFFDHYYLLLSVSACIGGLAAFGTLGLYRYVLRYMNERVVFSIAGGVLVSVMVTTAMTIFLQMPTGLSRGVLVIYALLAVVSLLAPAFWRAAPCSRARIMRPTSACLSPSTAPAPQAHSC